MIRTQISMTPEQAERLRALALIRQRSQAALLREALDDLLGADDRARRIERARRAFGAYRAGRSDIAERHDDELDEIYAS